MWRLHACCCLAHGWVTTEVDGSASTPGTLCPRDDGPGAEIEYLDVVHGTTRMPGLRIQA